MDLTEEQWCVLEPLLPEREQSDASPAKGGRPFRPARDVLNGVLWVLRTGAPWADMPGRYPPYQTCHRRFQRWVENGTLKRILRTLAQDLRDRGKLDLTEAYIDGTHAGARPRTSSASSISAAWSSIFEDSDPTTAFGKRPRRAAEGRRELSYSGSW